MAEVTGAAPSEGPRAPRRLLGSRRDAVGGAQAAAGADAPPDRRRRGGLATTARRAALGRFSSLTGRIVGFNLIGLGLLVAGVLLLNNYRDELIELRTQALETQGRIIAITIAESAASDADALGIDPSKLMVVLDKLVEPTEVRAQIFDRAARLMRDTSIHSTRADIVETTVLPRERLHDASTLDWLEGAVLKLRSMLYRDNSKDTNILGGVAHEREVYAALGGAVARGERINARGELIVSVSIPITRLKAVLGVLVLSTRGGDIDAIVRSERIAILQVFLVALAVSIVTSILLANTIARPIRRLAEAAEAAERGEARRPGGGGDPAGGEGGHARPEIPDLSARSDEVGYLSGALTRMTDALYSRIDATESFAADVAHEIKNPLTSLRSAVETMRLANKPAAREQLLNVIEHDVKRLDRLVTDISNASRLDAELVREAREEFDLNALLSNLVDYNQDKATKRGARIAANLLPGDLRVRGIEGRLAQVFVNLIGNAISFSPEGGVIRVAARVAPDPDGRVIVTVEDNGPGIPDDNLNSVFDRFYSSRPDSESFGEHSGLGLSISAQIVEAHGGVIRAENIGPAGAPERGARFVVELPA